MFKPKSTYRIQFHKEFNFKDFRKVIPYLTDLGIDTLYASPIFEAVPGSTHGYDTVNPLRINPEIGTEAELIAISRQLKEAGISWLQDIVPNHMAFHPQNNWLMDVLKKGADSDFAGFFDIDLRKEDGKLMVPFLGEDLSDAIENGAVVLKEKESAYFLSTGDADWPLSDNSSQKLAQLDDATRLPDKTLITTVAAEQFYRLCNWQETKSHINYRRFFTVNSLICLNVQNQQAFDLYHSYILTLVEKGIFQGLRIDHVDGLYDPKGYFERLRKAVGKEVYIVVEKILERGEEMPSEWPVEGNTGYDFLAVTNNILTNKKAEKPFNKLYKRVTGKKLDHEALLYEKKQAILTEHMAGELENLSDLFYQNELGTETEFPRKDLQDAIGCLLLEMPVYRYYEYKFPLNEQYKDKLEALISSIGRRFRKSKAPALLRRLLLEIPDTRDEDYQKRLGQFFQRCMQFTGPLMAKGVEDTLMFTYNRFIGHNEVGDAADAFGIGINAFHKWMEKQQRHWPYSMNASSTHDTKRGEDVRARLNVLTDLPEEWKKLIARLGDSTTALEGKFADLRDMHRNDMYMLVQTLIGVLPFVGQNQEDLKERLEQFVQKALREAKKRSDWAEPNEAYESALSAFATALADDKNTSAEQLSAFIKSIADFAIINSLVQLILKFTCPGVPDIYQGTELWDLSMVDPDNRRAVDFSERSSLLKVSSGKTLQELWESRLSGAIKLQLMHQLLGLRKSQSDILQEGEYIPLKVKGRHAKHILSFARKYQNEWLIVVLPIGLARLCDGSDAHVTQVEWKDTEIILPKGAPLGWEDLLSKRDGHKDVLRRGLAVAELFDHMPFAVIKLVGRPAERNAGILMHISALPSAFGIGDIGPEAYRFIDFLQKAGQKYWQILPITPIGKGNGYSPYSSNSSSAGNILFISPDLLYENGLLDEKDLAAFEKPSGDQVEFEVAEQQKSVLLAKAYARFRSGKFEDINMDFRQFISHNERWLAEFALYKVLQVRLESPEWYHWPEAYKCRDAKTLNDFRQQHAEEIEAVMWQQFIFFEQWADLKQYANQRGVSFIGDLPFYIDYGAHEVWANPSLFMLDGNLKPTALAGVPPDYFNEEGQLWGMPIFNWAAMKKDGYEWWMSRIKANLEHFDLLRLDHFRAFSAYWSVPAGETTAIAGKWVDGPAEDFFNRTEQELLVRLIAEDLGEESEGVKQLLRAFKLPGMRVVQFGFGGDVSVSAHIPHNFESPELIAYSGTHDNNTIKGWFKSEADSESKRRLSAYAGRAVDRKNVNKVITTLIYSSIARTVILPVQDMLGLDERSRMNTPGTQTGNWGWRLNKGVLTDELAREWSMRAELYGRR
ncbi:malto-oligosyltrehalose synthase [Pedobacter frigidisoli]|uniref:malto-oligosyltrehalose synthase n=1 Tax=Pedobacter frigidisoli TaxID=2530455 RepID=UPI002931346A|nr:malto-oligosyltrehalose synthase [Pedobacter frigidisoli]